MEFKILGPLDVRDGGREVRCRGRKPRLLLAFLLLHPNEIVSSDRLIEALWGDAAPDSAPKALQMHVSELRKLLEPDRAAGGSGRILQTRSPGYRVAVDPGQLDLERFEQAVGEARGAAAAGRAQHAGTLLREALALWRGPPLADLAEEEALQSEIARLAELRLAALEDRVEADLALGGHAALIAELESHAAKHPLRERVRAQLMLALYRSGRQAEALEVYRDTRASLVEELGIEPGRGLRELERQILAQDPVLDLPAAPAPAPPGGGDRRDAAARPETLVGRELEMERAAALLDAALAGHGALLLVGGEPGIGKSRLAEALAARADGAGARVVVGRCWEAGGAPAYWPWVQALRAYLREGDPETLRAQVAGSASDLVAILPELRELLTDLPAGEAPDSEGARFRLFDSVASFLRAAAADEPLAVFLDDLHAADAPSLLLLRFLGGQLAGARLLLVGCYRDTEARPELVEALGELSREPSVHRLALAGLDDAGSTRLLASVMGSAPDAELSARVHAQTHGNPLFTAEIGRLLASDESHGAEGGRLPIPRGVREAIGRRLQRRSEPCREVLALASVLGREFDPQVLRRVGDLDEGMLFEALDEGAAARLIGEVPGAAGRLRFSHILVRDALYDDLPAPRRLRLHRRIGAALEMFYARNPEPHLAELAHHHVAGGMATAGKAIDYAERAGARAGTLHAYEEAARHYATALDVLETTGMTDATRACELLLSLGEALSRAGSERESKDTLMRAAGIAEDVGSSGRLARAALGYGGRFTWARAGTDPELVPLLERALAAVGTGDAPTRARLLARLAAAKRDEPDGAGRAALAQEAVDLALQTGDLATLARAREGHLIAVEGPASSEDALAVSEELIALGQRTRDLERVYTARDFRLQAHWRLADRAGVDAELEALAGLADTLRQPAQRWHLGASRAMVALMEGRLRDAEHLIGEAAAIGSASETWNAVVSQRLQLFVLRRAQGRLAEVESAMSRSVHEFPALPRFRCALAHLHAELGQDAEARVLFDELLSRDLGHEYVDSEWLFSISLLPDTCAALRDADAAAALYALLLPYGDLVAQAPVEASFGSVARGLGVLATILGALDDAERHFEAALTIERRMRARPWVAHVQHGFAAALLARGRPADKARGRELLREAGVGYRALGMRSWAARAGALANPAP